MGWWDEIGMEWSGERQTGNEMVGKGEMRWDGEMGNGMVGM